MTGYANRVIHLPFPDLTGNPEDPVWVIIRNPKLLPADEMMSAIDGRVFAAAMAKAATEGERQDGGEDGEMPEAPAASRQELSAQTRDLIAKLVIAARVYDATWQPAFDPLTGKELDGGQPPLLPPPPWTPDIARRLPSTITMEISQKIGDALNPRKPETPTQTS